MTITDFCEEVNNWFDVDRQFGVFTITDGKISGVTDLLENQFFRIIGSVFNDGVYQNNSELNLTDETFDGAVWLMAVPPSVIELLAEMNKWLDDNSAVLDSPYTSESFGGYSYTKGGSGSGGDSNGNVTWQSHFASKLNRWRKIRRV